MPEDSLLCSLVRSILQYCSVVWSPTARTHVERIERVQRSFTRFAICKILGGLSSPMPPYENRCWQPGLELFENRRSHAQYSFTAALLFGNIDSPSLLSSIPFFAPNCVHSNRPPLVIPFRELQWAVITPSFVQFVDLTVYTLCLILSFPYPVSDPATEPSIIPSCINF